MNLVLKLSVTFLLLVSCQHTKPVQSAANGGHLPTAQLNQSRATAEAHGKNYVISTQGIATTKIAEEILKQGGNLIDAFVAASFAISVERPQSTGLGGGGFLVYHDAKTKKTMALDFRERAPHKATRDMYLDAQKKAQPLLAQDGILAVGIPGLVKGLSEVHQKYGKLPWKKVMAPSIELARTGFPVYEELHEALVDRQAVLAKDPEARRIFLTKNAQALPTGHHLVQKDLAKSLELIARDGAKTFYHGELAEKFADFSVKRNGIIRKKDFMDYQVKWRTPIQGDFLGYKFFSMPPPSSGGIHVYQFLKMLENEKLSLNDLNTAEGIHLKAATLQSVFADRAVHLGDPDFYKVPVMNLTDLSYMQKRRADILPMKARTAAQVQAGEFSVKKESVETTHMSMMDLEGNAISSTQTINGWMGAGIVAPETGILLNNEMDDFSIQAGQANLYGAIGGRANEIQPLKTPLSSMSPTIILDAQSKPVMAIGAPGGTTIISCTAQTIYNHLFFKLPLWESVTNIRIHHQWNPDKLLIEQPGPAMAEVDKLKSYGYDIKLQPFICKIMATSRQGDQMTAVADPRDIGTSKGQ